MPDLANVLRGIAEDINKVYLGTNVVYTRSVGGSYDVSTQALLDQATIDGYTAPTGTYLTALDAYIVELKAQGIWALCDVIYLTASGGDRNFAKYNLKDPTQFNLVEYNSPTYTVGEGFTGDGVSAYLDTTFVPSINAVQASIHSQSLSVYTRSHSTTGNQGVLGTAGGSAFIRWNRVSSSELRYSIGDVIGTQVTTTTIGGLQLDRLNSSDKNLRKNGVLVDTTSGVTTPYTNQAITILALLDQNSNIIQYQDAQISHLQYGADLSAKATENYNAIQTYMTAISKQV